MLAQIVGRPDTNNSEIVELLKCDSVLTAKVLRACNSAAFGLKEPVTSVDQALLLLGHNEIHNLVLSLAFGGAMSVPVPGYALKENELWLHALRTAAATGELARGTGGLETDEAVGFTIGLLHDIGKLVMAQALAARAQSAIHIHSADEGLGSIESEREVLGTDHAEVGACLLYLWRLPDAVVEAVANHHHPVLQPVPRLSALAHAANRIAHLAADAECEGHAFKTDEPIVRVFDLSPERQESLVGVVRGAEDRVKGLMAMA